MELGWCLFWDHVLKSDLDALGEKANRLHTLYYGVPEESFSTEIELAIEPDNSAEPNRQTRKLLDDGHIVGSAETNELKATQDITAEKLRLRCAALV